MDGRLDFFVTDRIKNGKVRIEYCPTEEMNADIFTKPLQGSAFQKFRDRLLNIESEAQTSEAPGTAPQECVADSHVGDPGTSESRIQTCMMGSDVSGHYLDGTGGACGSSDVVDYFIWAGKEMHATENMLEE